MARTRSAATYRAAGDPLLRGRTYAIPFEDVWQGTLRLVRGKLRRWSLDHADDQVGFVRAHVASPIKSLAGIVEIRIELDANGQTRVEAEAATPSAFHDFGANVRRIRRFMAALDGEAQRERDRRQGAALAVR